MPSLSPRATGVIEMERTPSRVETFYDERDDLDCAGELTRLAHGGLSAGPSYDSSADEVILADLERLTEDLHVEFVALRRLIAIAKS